MMRAFTMRAAVATVAAVTLSACGSDNPSAPVQNVDLNTVISQMSAGNPSSYSGATSMMGTPYVGSSAALVPSACAWSASLQGFACPSRTANGLTITGSYYLLDANGASLSIVDPTKTAAVRTLMDISGTSPIAAASGLTGSMTLTQHSDMTMSGLLTNTHTLNGTTTGHQDATITAPQATHSVIDMTTTTKDLVLPPPSSTTHYPQSGTIAMDLAGTVTLGTGSPLNVSMNEVMTFNGTSVVTVKITSGGITTTCTFDMASTSSTAMQCN